MNNLDDSPAVDQPRLSRFWTNKLELISVILLSVASLAVAWCGYQSSEWGGEQLRLNQRSSSLRNQATHERTLEYLRGVGENALFVGWIDAYAEQNQELLDFYRSRFSPTMETAVAAWLALDPLNNPEAPRLPVLMPEYRSEELERAEQIDAEATDLMARSIDANSRSSAYVLNTLIFATVLFFAGLSSKVNWFPVRMLTVGMSALMFLIGIIRLLTLPIV